MQKKIAFICFGESHEMAEPLVSKFGFNSNRRWLNIACKNYFGDVKTNKKLSSHEAIALYCFSHFEISCKIFSIGQYDDLPTFEELVTFDQIYDWCGIDFFLKQNINNYFQWIKMLKSLEQKNILIVPNTKQSKIIASKKYLKNPLFKNNILKTKFIQLKDIELKHCQNKKVLKSPFRSTSVGVILKCDSQNQLDEYKKSQINFGIETTICQDFSSMFKKRCEIRMYFNQKYHLLYWIANDTKNHWYSSEMFEKNHKEYSVKMIDKIKTLSLFAVQNVFHKPTSPIMRIDCSFDGKKAILNEIEDMGNIAFRFSLFKQDLIPLIGNSFIF